MRGVLVTDFNIELQKTRDEIDRLVRNWQTLLDFMPEMVFLLRDDFIIEYQNRSAKECFGDLCAQECGDDLRQVGTECRLFSSDADEIVSTSGLTETVINGVPVEYSAAPFVGYTGAHLIMVVMRDISQRKQQEQELREFNTNIEVILNRKIVELQESEETRKRLSRQVNSLKTQLGFHHDADRMVGSSRVMRELREMVHQVAKSDATILITGESGTGKELVANLVKASSNRNDGPFLKINCNAINDSILESDLFGYEKGAFTGAVTRKKGKFEIVDGGTIFLDEIGDISPRMQASLLRVLQNGEVVRVGGTEPVKVDVRVIAATNVDLATAVKEKKFRLDLYYRLNIINIAMPPLRERKEDIVELVSHFVKHYRVAFKKDIEFVPQSIINRLLNHEWPGNVRELENIIQRAVLMAKEKMITEGDLFFDQNMDQDQVANPMANLQAKIGLLPLKGILAEFETEIIRQALLKYKGNVSKAASDLKIGKTALYDKMKRHHISAKEIKRGL
ncbi:MAG TPA: AAA family ATPase [Desulfobulbus sp.]|nr:AAA family ATPase [Desulfobulbus sp.]